MVITTGRGWKPSNPDNPPPVGEWARVQTVSRGGVWFRAKLDGNGKWKDEEGRELSNVTWWDLES